MAEISDLLDKLPIEKALTTIVNHLTKTAQKNNSNKTQRPTSLLSNPLNETITILFSVKNIPEIVRDAPIQIKLPHSIIDEVSDVCVVVKDPQRKWKDLFAKAAIPQVQKVIGVKKLKEKYNSYKSKRELSAAFDVFLCDNRIVHLMPRTLGKPFLSSKKLPFAIKLREKDVATPLKDALHSTWLQIRCGPTAAVKIGRGNMPIAELTANAKTVIADVAHFYKSDKHYANTIESIYIQATNSISLPVYIASLLAVEDDITANATTNSAPVEKTLRVLKAGSKKKKAAGQQQKTAKRRKAQ